MRSGRGLELVSVACGGPDASSLRWNHHKFKRVFEDALDTAPARRYRIERMFVEHVFQEVLVSARTLHSPLGPSAVSAASRSHLRLLDGGSASRCSRTEEAVELPAELIRRPAAPRAARARRERGERTERPAGAAGARPADLAPRHPAVRAQRRREIEAQRRVAERAEAPRRRVGSSAGPLPVGLRRLAVLSAVVLVLALAVSLGIVVSGLVGAGPAGAPGRTTTATVRTGQSLWDVAAATGEGDIDRTMERIVELNGLESSVLEPGQVLVVPAE